MMELKNIDCDESKQQHNFFSKAVLHYYDVLVNKFYKHSAIDELPPTSNYVDQSDASSGDFTEEEMFLGNTTIIEE